MNEEICSINNKGKTVKNEWETDSNFLPASYIVLKKRQFFFHNLLANLFKQRCVSSVTSYT